MANGNVQKMGGFMKNIDKIREMNTEELADFYRILLLVKYVFMGKVEMKGASTQQRLQIFLVVKRD